jgi:hypothetical protein
MAALQDLTIQSVGIEQFKTIFAQPSGCKEPVESAFRPAGHPESAPVAHGPWFSPPW